MYSLATLLAVLTAAASALPRPYEIVDNEVAADPVKEKTSEVFTPLPTPSTDAYQAESSIPRHIGVPIETLLPMAGGVDETVANEKISKTHTFSPTASADVYHGSLAAQDENADDQPFSSSHSLMLEGPRVLEREAKPPIVAILPTAGGHWQDGRWVHPPPPPPPAPIPAKVTKKKSGDPPPPPVTTTWLQTTSKPSGVRTWTMPALYTPGARAYHEKVPGGLPYSNVTEIAKAYCVDGNNEAAMKAANTDLCQAWLRRQCKKPDHGGVRKWYCDNWLHKGCGHDCKSDFYHQIGFAATQASLALVFPMYDVNVSSIQHNIDYNTQRWFQSQMYVIPILVAKRSVKALPEVATHPGCEAGCKVAMGNSVAKRAVVAGMVFGRELVTRNHLSWMNKTNIAITGAAVNATVRAVGVINSTKLLQKRSAQSDLAVLGEYDDIGNQLYDLVLTSHLQGRSLDARDVFLARRGMWNPLARAGARISDWAGRFWGRLLSIARIGGRQARQTRENNPERPEEQREPQEPDESKPLRIGPFELPNIPFLHEPDDAPSEPDTASEPGTASEADTASEPGTPGEPYSGPHVDISSPNHITYEHGNLVGDPNWHYDYDGQMWWEEHWDLPEETDDLGRTEDGRPSWEEARDSMWLDDDTGAWLQMNAPRILDPDYIVNRAGKMWDYRMDAKVVLDRAVMPEGEDPDDFVSEDDPDAIFDPDAEALATDLLDYEWFPDVPEDFTDATELPEDTTAYELMLENRANLDEWQMQEIVKQLPEDANDFVEPQPQFIEEWLNDESNFQAYEPPPPPAPAPVVAAPPPPPPPPEPAPEPEGHHHHFDPSEIWDDIRHGNDVDWDGDGHGGGEPSSHGGSEAGEGAEGAGEGAGESAGEGVGEAVGEGVGVP